MKVVVEQFERLEQIVDWAVLPKERVTGRLECQRDDEIPQSDVQPVVLVCTFFEVSVGQGNVFVDNRLHVFRGEKFVARRKHGFL